jgi:hypothetical protein
MADPQTARAELFANLRTNLDDEATWSVVGDLLAAQGDPHGELIALDQQRVARAGERSLELQVMEHRIGELFDRHVASWLGPLARASNVEPSWRRGFLTAVTIHGRAAGAAKNSPSNLGIVATLERLLDLPAAALLRELTIPRIASVAKSTRLLARAADAGTVVVDTLALPQARCEQFGALAQLTALRRLVLNSSTPRDLDELAELPRLERLELARSDVDLQTFEHGFQALRTLDLRVHPNVGRARLTSLAGLTGLRELDLGEAGWESVSGLAGLHRLERLHLRGTDVFDLRPLAKLERLRMLDLRGCPVADLEPIAGLRHLEELRVGWTRVRDVRCLRSLTRLKVLEIAGTAVRELEPLFELPALVRIDVQGSDVRHVRPLTERGVQVLGRPHVDAPTWRDIAEGLLRD